MASGSYPRKTNESLAWFRVCRYKPSSHQGRCAKHFSNAMHLTSEAYSLESTTDEALGVEDGITGIHRCLVFCGITDETLFGREGDVGGSRSVTLCIAT